MSTLAFVRRNRLLQNLEKSHRYAIFIFEILKINIKNEDLVCNSEALLTNGKNPKKNRKEETRDSLWSRPIFWNIHDTINTYLTPLQLLLFQCGEQMRRWAVDLELQTRFSFSYYLWQSRKYKLHINETFPRFEEGDCTETEVRVGITSLTTSCMLNKKIR